MGVLALTLQLSVIILKVEYTWKEACLSVFWLSSIYDIMNVKRTPLCFRATLIPPKLTCMSQVATGLNCWAVEKMAVASLIDMLFFWPKRLIYFLILCDQLHLRFLVHNFMKKVKEWWAVLLPIFSCISNPLCLSMNSCNYKLDS